MKKILLLLVVLFITLCTVNASEIKFIQVTDVHYSLHNDYSKKVLEQTIQDINSIGDVSFVIFTGDNINEPNEKNLINFTQMIKGLKVPYYVVIGNHDVYRSGGLSKERYLEILRGKNIFKYKSPNYVIKRGEFVFIVADGAKEVMPGAAGYFKEKTLLWLDKQLTKYSNKKVIICQHFPLIEPKPSKSHATYKVEDYWNILNKHDNVIAVISGHYHINAENMKNGVYHISTPSLLVQPNQYKIIDIVTTKEFSPMIYTQLRDVNVK